VQLVSRINPQVYPDRGSPAGVVVPETSVVKSLVEWTGGKVEVAAPASGNHRFEIGKLPDQHGIQVHSSQFRDTAELVTGSAGNL